MSAAGRISERPRILIDAIAYSPRDGGFTKALHDLLDTCRRLPEFEFVVAHHRKYSSVFRSFSLKTYPVAFPQRLRFFASLVLLPIIARRIKATAVHCEISALPWFVGVPGSVTVHDLYFMIDPRAGGQTLRQRVMRVYWERVFVASIHRARVVKAISETTADDLRRLVAPDLSILVCEPRFVAPPSPDPIRRLPGPEENVRLLFVGSVVPRRHLPFLFRSLQLVRRRWRLDVVGSLWWGTDELESAAKDERVRVHGYVPDSERERLMTEAHLLIAPSRYEGFGYPAAEAMIRGLPVFTSDVGAFREYVPSNWRFPLDDPAALATMIDTLDDARYSAMAAAARTAVARFDPEAHLDSHRRLIRLLVSESSRVTHWTQYGGEWRPGSFDRLRALARRALISTLGDRVEGQLHEVYHRVLRRAGRFGPPEDAATMAILGAVAARARTILDIGANVGRYTWFLHRHASSHSALFALEPHPAAARLLRSAVGISPACTVLEVAAGDRDELARLVVPNGPFGSPVSALAWIQSPQADNERGDLQVAARRIDSLIQDGIITVAGPVFMKIDVEGSEGRVLRGAAELLRRHRPVIYFECQSASLARQGEAPDTVWSELERVDYQILANRAGRFVPVDRVQSDVADYLAIPDLDRVDRDEPLDAAAIIAILDIWATRESNT